MFGNDYPSNEDLSNTTNIFTNNSDRCKWELDESPDYQRSTQCQDSSGASVSINLKNIHMLSKLYFSVLKM